MFKRLKSAPAVLLVAGLALAAPACAPRGAYYGAQRDVRDVERRAYDDGFRRGFDHGVLDARYRRDFKVDRDRSYRDVDGRGWGRDRDRFARFYRDGYRQGYGEGYEQVARRGTRGR